MTPEQEAELIEKMADAIGEVWDCPEEDDERLLVYARAALSIAKPVIRDEALEEAMKAAAPPAWQKGSFRAEGREEAVDAIAALKSKGQ
jgi:hypothetical protein